MEKNLAKKLFKEITKRKSDIEKGINYSNGIYGLTIDITLKEEGENAEIAFTEKGNTSYRELGKSRIGGKAFSDCKIMGHIEYSRNDIIIFQKLWTIDRNNIQHTIDIGMLQFISK